MRGARECSAQGVVHVLVGTYGAQRRGQIWRCVRFGPNRAIRAILATRAKRAKRADRADRAGCRIK